MKKEESLVVNKTLTDQANEVYNAAMLVVMGVEMIKEVCKKDLYSKEDMIEAFKAGQIGGGCFTDFFEEHTEEAIEWIEGYEKR